MARYRVTLFIDTDKDPKKFVPGVIPDAIHNVLSEEEDLVDYSVVQCGEEDVSEDCTIVDLM